MIPWTSLCFHLGLGKCLSSVSNDMAFKSSLCIFSKTFPPDGGTQLSVPQSSNSLCLKWE